MNSEELAEAIVTRAVEYEDISFAEINRLWPETRGDHWLYFPEDRPNTIVWTDCSLLLDEALSRILGKRLWFHTVPSMVYLIDGAVPHLPEARRWVKPDFKKAHWLPVVLKPKRP